MLIPSATRGGGSPLRGVLWAMLGFFMYATSDAIIKTLTARYAIFQIVSMQVTFAIIPVAIVAWREGHWRAVRPIHPRIVAIRGLMAGVGTLLGYYAFSTLPMTDVYAIAFGVPIVVTILSIPILGEKVGIYRWSAVVVGFIGILIMVRPGAVELTTGHLAAFLAMLNGAVITLILRKIAGKERAPAMVLAVMLGLLVVSLPATLVVARMPTLADIALVACSGLIMGSAQFVMLQAFRQAPAASVAPMQYTMMVWALFYGAVLFGDSFRLNVLIGGAVVMGSSLYIMHRERKLSAAGLR
jgi:drug/metabolite transporter (DMT)-like permease